MLMGFSGAALPSRVTLPETEPVVVASTVFPAGALVAAGCSVVVLSLLPHPVMARAIRVARARCENLLLMLENSSLAELRILTRSSTEGARFLVRYERQRQRRPAEAGRYKCKDYLPFAASFSHSQEWLCHERRALIYFPPDCFPTAPLLPLPPLLLAEGVRPVSAAC